MILPSCKSLKLLSWFFCIREHFYSHTYEEALEHLTMKNIVLLTPFERNIHSALLQIAAKSYLSYVKMFESQKEDFVFAVHKLLLISSQSFVK